MLERHLGLKDVQSNLQTVQPGGCYWIRCQSERTALSLVCFSPLGRIASPRTLLYSVPLKNNALEEAAVALQDCVVRYLESKSEKRFFTSLAHRFEFDFTLRDRTIFILFPGLLLSLFDEVSIYRYFAAAKEYAASHRFAAVFLPIGDVPDFSLSFIFHHFALFNGVASLNPQGEDFNWLSLIWKTDNSLSHSIDLKLNFSRETGFALAEVKKSEAAGEDNNTIFVVSPNKDFQLSEREAVYLESNKEAFEHGMQSFDASLLFCLETIRDIEGLSQMIYELRKARSNRLKIYVREKPDYVRAHSETMLLEAGADMVFPKTTPASHYSAVIRGLKDNTFTRNLPVSLDAFLARHRTIELRGALTLLAFAQAMLTFCDNHTGKSALPGTLLTLKLREDISAAAALDVFHPHRLGDIGARWKRSLLVFFNNCTPGNVETALNNAFLLPTAQLFEGYTVENNPVRVSALCLGYAEAAEADETLQRTERKRADSNDAAVRRAPDEWITANTVTPVYVRHPDFIKEPQNAG